MEIPPEPEGFRELCERIGLALMLGQKVQYALAGYYGTYMRVRNGWTVDQAKAKLDHHLSTPMGTVVADIERDAPLPDGLWAQVKQFKSCRNWLVHDFDEEATPYLARGERIDHYREEMESIAQFAQAIMYSLDDVGRALAGV